MSENVQVTLIIVVGIVAVVAFALSKYDKLGKFSFSASKKNVTAKMEQHQNTGINISGNNQAGNGNEIAAETANVLIENNLQQGDDNLIRAAAKSKK
ncbi:MAG: hypothetical protein ACXWT1_12800 [Methylobacter sp.]